MAILPNKFESRTDMADLLETVFPHTAEDTHLSATRGGRFNALQQVEQINYIKYPKTRNFLTGDVTRLSPYLTHGILELGELRKTAQANKAPDKYSQNCMIHVFGFPNLFYKRHIRLSYKMHQLGNIGICTFKACFPILADDYDNIIISAKFRLFRANIGVDQYLILKCRLFIIIGHVQWW